MTRGAENQRGMMMQDGSFDRGLLFSRHANPLSATCRFQPRAALFRAATSIYAHEHHLNFPLLLLETAATTKASEDGRKHVDLSGLRENFRRCFERNTTRHSGHAMKEPIRHQTSCSCAAMHCVLSQSSSRSPLPTRAHSLGAQAGGEILHDSRNRGSVCPSDSRCGPRCQTPAPGLGGMEQGLSTQTLFALLPVLRAETFDVCGP